VGRLPRRGGQTGAAIAPTPLRALGCLAILVSRARWNARTIEEEKQPFAISTLVRCNVEHPRYDLRRNDVERRLVLPLACEKVSLARDERLHLHAGKVTVSPNQVAASDRAEVVE
jgi:hypothetical protein